MLDNFLKRRTAAEWRAHIALIVLIIAIGTNMAIALTLKGRLDSLKPTSVVPVGTVLSEVTGTDDAGGTRTLSLVDSRPTLLYVSRKGCGWCDRNQRNVEAIGLQASARFRILELSPAGVGPSGPKAFGVERLQVSEEVLQNLGLRGTPYTVLVSPEGRVLDSWAGAFGPQTGPAIARALSVELPGLMP